MCCFRLFVIIFGFSCLGISSHALARPAEKSHPKQESSVSTPDRSEKKIPKSTAKPPKGKKTKEATKFLRIRSNDKKKVVALETAIVRYVPRDCGKQSPTVDLVAAVHVADSSYYDKLNKLFKEYDAVLYELVAPEGTTIPKNAPRKGGGHPVSTVQNMMSNILELEFQLKGVDYTVKNFVHADMSPDEVAESMRKRGESIWTMFMRAMGYAMSQQGKASGGTGDVQLLFAFMAKDRALALKRIMAKQFEDMEGAVQALSGPEGSTLISERNKAALAVLRKELTAGKKKIAIFYGAGHMSDFETRLQNDFGLAHLNTRWLSAWDMKSSSKPASSKPNNQKP